MIAITKNVMHADLYFKSETHVHTNAAIKETKNTISIDITDILSYVRLNIVCRILHVKERICEIFFQKLTHPHHLHEVIMKYLERTQMLILHSTTFV